MASTFAELHDELRATARDLLGKAGSEAAVDWRLLAESGWLGLEVPEELDGAGATAAEMAVIAQELGRAASRSPYLGAVVLGVGALLQAEPGDARDELLRGIAAGEVVAAVALSSATYDAAPGFRIETTPTGARVHGRAEFVPDAAEAGRLLLPAADGGGSIVLVAVGNNADRLAVDERPVLDATRRLADVTADGLEVDGDALWPLPADALSRLAGRAAVAVACDSLGLAATMLDRTVTYAGVRHQFGRAIGSFQAVKHACADMLVQVSVARQLVDRAVELVADGDPEASVAVSMAKSYACGAAVDVVGKAMQLHGGIGYTWESGVHVYLKRAALNRSLFGSPAEHRRRLATRYVGS